MYKGKSSEGIACIGEIAASVLLKNTFICIISYIRDLVSGKHLHALTGENCLCTCILLLLLHLTILIANV